MGRPRGIIILLCGAALLAGAEPLRGQASPAGELELDLTGRVQIQFSTTSVGEEELGEEAPPATAFEMRRVRLGTNFAYDDWIAGKLEAEVTLGLARLTDAYVDLALTPALRVRAGQFKKPFGLFELESNTRIITIERSVRIRGLAQLTGVLPGETHLLLAGSRYLGRDVGLMVSAAGGGVGVSAGIFNGEGPNALETEGSKAYAARVEAAPMEALTLAGSVSSRPYTWGDSEEEERATAYSVDLTWGGFREEGLRVMAEAMFGDNALRDPATAPSMVGVQAAASWFAPVDGRRVEGVEPLFRISWADPDTDADSNEGVFVTPGFNLYFSGRNRLMVNGDVYVPSQDGLDAQYALRTQMQIYF
ncbi:MAG: porin [Gemmatimonadota bacterium]|jgi:hypothetical protein